MSNYSPLLSHLALVPVPAPAPIPTSAQLPLLARSRPTPTSANHLPHSLLPPAAPPPPSTASRSCRSPLPVWLVLADEKKKSLMGSLPYVLFSPHHLSYNAKSVFHQFNPFPHPPSFLFVLWLLPVRYDCARAVGFSFLFSPPCSESGDACRYGLVFPFPLHRY